MESWASLKTCLWWIFSNGNHKSKLVSKVHCCGTKLTIPLISHSPKFLVCCHVLLRPLISKAQFTLYGSTRITCKRVVQTICKDRWWLRIKFVFDTRFRSALIVWANSWKRAVVFAFLVPLNCCFKSKNYLLIVFQWAEIWSDVAWLSRLKIWIVWLKFCKTFRSSKFVEVWKEIM